MFADPLVRDSSADALGVAMKVVGEKVMMPFLPDVDALKLGKVSNTLFFVFKLITSSDSNFYHEGCKNF